MLVALFLSLTNYASLLKPMHNPDIISIVESWLCADIPDDEISIPGYQVLRKDRNRHGGGVLMYIRNLFTATVLSPHYSNNLEILPVEICFHNSKFCITVFYRPPNSPAFIFDTLSNFLVSLNIPSFSHFILLGDFNVDMSNLSHPLYSKICSVLEYFDLSQVVTGFTHTSPSGSTSLIDLVLSSSPSKLLSCTTIPLWTIQVLNHTIMVCTSQSTGTLNAHSGQVSTEEPFGVMRMQTSERPQGLYPKLIGMH